MTKFWVLEDPDDRDAEHRRAEWDPDGELKYQIIRCPIDPGHQRAGARLSQTKMVLPDLPAYDFVWGSWYCLVQESVLQVLKSAGLTGLEVLPAAVKFRRSSRPAPKFWELVATGSAGR
jgi:hypothetical protein